MNTIYRIAVNADDYMYFVLDDYEVISKMGDNFEIQSFGTSIKDIWKAPNGQFLESDSGSIKIPDISNWSPSVLVLNQKAHNLLLPHVAQYGEMLDVNIESQKYFIFNIMSTIDDNAIDTDKSRKSMLDGIEVGVKSLAFIPCMIKDDTLIFKTSYDNGAYLYCTEIFKNMVEELGLTGLVFDTKLALDPQEG